MVDKVYKEFKIVDGDFISTSDVRDCFIRILDSDLFKCLVPIVGDLSPTDGLLFITPTSATINAALTPKMGEWRICGSRTGQGPINKIVVFRQQSGLYYRFVGYTKTCAIHLIREVIGIGPWLNNLFNHASNGDSCDNSLSVSSVYDSSVPFSSSDGGLLSGADTPGPTACGLPVKHSVQGEVDPASICSDFSASRTEARRSNNSRSNGDVQFIRFQLGCIKEETEALKRIIPSLQSNIQVLLTNVTNIIKELDEM